MPLVLLLVAIALGVGLFVAYDRRKSRPRRTLRREEDGSFVWVGGDGEVHRSRVDPTPAWDAADAAGADGGGGGDGGGGDGGGGGGGD